MNTDGPTISTIHFRIDSRRSGSPPVGCDRSGDHTGGACGKSGDGDDPRGLQYYRRSGADRARRQSEPPGWQCDRRDHIKRGGRTKLSELLREAVPSATTIALLVNPTNPNAESQSKNTQEAGLKLGLKVHVLNARTERDFDGSLQSCAN